MRARYTPSSRRTPAQRPRRPHQTNISNKAGTSENPGQPAPETIRKTGCPSRDAAAAIRSDACPSETVRRSEKAEPHRRKQMHRLRPTPGRPERLQPQMPSMPREKPPIPSQAPGESTLPRAMLRMSRTLIPRRRRNQMPIMPRPSPTSCQCKKQRPKRNQAPNVIEFEITVLKTRHIQAAAPKALLAQP